MQGFFMLLMMLFCNPIVLAALVVIVIVYVKNNVEYKDCAYHNITHNSYFSMRFDKGRYGEYLTYKNLKKYEELGAKFLFNAYIPRENGETTEIDVLMICSKGIFVFESKNYSGWIFGSENQKNWHQTLPAGRGKSRKEHFYNPVMQNRTHVKHLKTLLGEQVPMRSIITFSDRCTLKSIQITSSDVSVINRHNVYAVVTDICNQTPNQLLSSAQINEIYNKVYPYTQVSEATKIKHIANIQNSKKPAEAITVTESVVEAVANRTNVTYDENMHPKTETRKLQCPKCGAELALRTARRGANAGNQFYGCSNYPKCRYIQDIKQ